jgi:hypothetical protein
MHKVAILQELSKISSELEQRGHLEAAAKLDDAAARYADYWQTKGWQERLDQAIQAFASAAGSHGFELVIPKKKPTMTQDYEDGKPVIVLNWQAQFTPPLSEDVTTIAEESGFEAGGSIARKQMANTVLEISNGKVLYRLVLQQGTPAEQMAAIQSALKLRLASPDVTVRKPVQTKIKLEG